jgi:hypothetical protein
MRFIGVTTSAIFGWLACFALSPGFAQDASFHKATGPGELALQAIFSLHEKDDDVVFFAIQAQWRDKKKDAIYRGYFSPKLVSAWKRAEREAVEKNCQGKYIDGDICGISVNPIICAQDVSKEGYLFRTEHVTSTAALISYQWPQYPKVIATYRMILRDGRWILDGVSCNPYPSFNMPSAFGGK